MSIYDMASAIQPVDIVGSYQQGQSFGNALAEMRRKREQEVKAEEVRNGLAQFYRLGRPEQRTAMTGPDLLSMASAGAAGPAMMPNSPMPSALSPMARLGNDGFNRVNAAPMMVRPQEMVTPATPSSFDYQGAADYLASNGQFEQAGALAKLRSFSTPEGMEFGLNPQRGINPQTGELEFFVTNSSGMPKFLGVRDQPKLDVKGGWIIGANGQPEKPLPMTPAEQAAQGRADAQLGISGANLNLAQQEAAARREREAREAEVKATKVEQDRKGKYKAVDDLDATLAAYEAELRGSSRADLLNPAGKKAIRLGNLATQLQMAYKTAAELGAITGPDWAIINRVVATPSGAKAALIGTDGLLTQLGEVRALSRRQREQLDKNYGAQQSAGFSVQAPNGKTYSFPSQQAADDFRKKAGIR